MEGVFDKIERSSGIQEEAGDYVEDGLLYCGKCGTPKQVRVELFDQVRTPMCLCKCEAEKRDKEAEEFERQQSVQEVNRLRRLGFPDADMQDMTFSADDWASEKLSTVARRYVENFDEMKDRGKGLLLYGSVGTGKTFIAACIANALIDQGRACLVTNFARLINELGGMFDGKQKYIDDLGKYELLVIDDLASERDTEYMGETVQNIIDARYRSGKPLIVTTNLTGDELKAPAEVRKQRIYSRLLEMCVPVEVNGADRRKQKLKGEHKELSDILGL